ncbi:MAG: MBL fold metallo-hydrolase [Sphingobacteriales bacterium]|nr:MAG: MBL fold metallo-hydrolase [Sphingobacteriales bacterium]
MSLQITSLNSGSNGNCYYVGNDQEAVLVDAGLSCRETERRMNRVGLSMARVKAIFISHEHGDHIKGLDVISRKYRLPVYITWQTMKSGRLNLDPELVRPFREGEPVEIGRLSIHAFLKKHDAADPHSFVISGNEVNVGVFTDLGIACDGLTHYFRLCHAAFLEANYDEAMLENGRYPYHLKQRIRGGYGHLSNGQALEVFRNHRSPNLSHLLLAHLSKENNCPLLAAEMFRPFAGNTQVVVASRYEPSPVFLVTPGSVALSQEPLLALPQRLVQASLF